MGVSLTTCYQKNRPSEESREEKKDIRSSPEEKKLVLRSNPKRYQLIYTILNSVAQKIDNKKIIEENLNIEEELKRHNSNSNKYTSETSDVSTGIQSNRRLSMNKRVTDNFYLNNSSTSSFDKKKLSPSFVKETNNYFITFENSHNQMSFLGRTFKTINNKDLNEKLDQFLENEVSRNSISFPHVEFKVEAIIDRIILYKEEIQNLQNIKSIGNLKINNSVFVSSTGACTGNNLNINLNSNCGTNINVNTETRNLNHSQNEHEILKTQQSNNTSNSSNSNLFRFIVLSNIFLYEFEFCLINCTLNLSRKLNLIAIEFFSISANYKKFMIHVNNILDNGGNIEIVNENSIHIVFCICNILFFCYSATKNLVVVPKYNYFYEKTKKIYSYQKIKDFYNKFAEEIFNKIGSLIPYDKDEVLTSLIPLSKIETKFTDTKIDKMIILTNKKILEISPDNFDLSKINIFPLSKMKKINVYDKSHKFQIIFDDASTCQYSTINSKTVIRLIKFQHSNECLLELDIIRID